MGLKVVCSCIIWELYGSYCKRIRGERRERGIDGLDSIIMYITYFLYMCQTYNMDVPQCMFLDVDVANHVI